MRIYCAIVHSFKHVDYKIVYFKDVSGISYVKT